MKRSEHPLKNIGLGWLGAGINGAIVSMMISPIETNVIVNGIPCIEESKLKTFVPFL
jgi:hypothetical protein